MTKLTDVLRRLAEADQDQVAQAVGVLDDVPEAESGPVERESTSGDLEPRQPPAMASWPIEATPLRPDIERLRDFVTQNVGPEREPGGSVLLLVTPRGIEDDAHAATAGLIRELAAALAEGQNVETLVLDMPPTGLPVQRSDGADPEAVASIADLIRSRARLAEIVQPGGATRIWRPACDQFLRRSPPAPWPALAALLGQCRQHFAWTLVDGGWWDAAESAELARRCDSVYVVLYEGCTRRIAAQRTLDELRRAGANVLCCLFVGRTMCESTEAQ
jgi:hypothetical protein